MKNIETLEKRIDKIANIFEYIEESLNDLPVRIPEAMKKRIKHHLLGDEELKQLVNGIRDRRPPKFLIMGRTGVGKSSLINAMYGKYLAKVSDVRVGTINAKQYSYELNGRKMFEVIDTRGIGESIDTSVSAEKALIETIQQFVPDAILFLVKDRSYINEDVKVLKKIQQEYNRDVPVIGLWTQVDELTPARYKLPHEYPPAKLEKINDAHKYLKEIFDEHDISALDVLPISSYVEWSHEPNDDSDNSELTIEFDGRYNIDKLLDLLTDNMDIAASIYLLISARVNEAAKKIANKFTKVMSATASAIATTPIPMSDIVILLPIQMLLIKIIAYLGGRELSYDTAKELLISLGGAGMAGFAFRTLAQQGSKLLNTIFPGSGSLVSSTVAGAGTYAIGQSAIAYFINHIPKAELQKEMEKARLEYNDQSNKTNV